MNRLTRKEAVNVVKCIKYLKGVVEDNKLPRSLLSLDMLLNNLSKYFTFKRKTFIFQIDFNNLGI